VDTPELVIIGLLMAVGLVGIIVPALPGLVLIWVGVLIWAVVERGTLAWTVFALATVILGVTQIVKYLLPGRRLQAAGVPVRSIIVGGVLAVIGFFVIPVIGLFIGFVVGVYLAERMRLGPRGGARESTVHALKAAGMTILIELLGGLVIIGGWLAALQAT
jgi:uncharacterized protein YqgC (DUF456 family)